MDVEVLLAELRTKIARLNEHYLSPNAPDDDEKVTLGEEIAEKFDDLDEWLSKGGALPREWSR